MLLSRKLLLRILGMLWLFDGLLQLQPKMFTMDMVNGIMVPTVHSQPYLIATSLQWLIAITTQHLTLVNLGIAIVQICLGIALLLFSERWIKGLVIASVAWSLIVWFGGEGFSMLLAAQGSVITGAPGAVLLYLLLGLVVYPRQQSRATSKGAEAKVAEGEFISRIQLRRILAGFWLFAALLQLQPYWWQAGQISQVIGSMTGQGGFLTVARFIHLLYTILIFFDPLIFIQLFESKRSEKEKWMLLFPRLDHCLPMSERRA